MFSQTIKVTKSITINSKSSTALLSSDDFLIKTLNRSFSFEQKIISAVNSLNPSYVNKVTYDLVFNTDKITEKKGFLTNFADKQIQSLPQSMISFRKALNPEIFFTDNPHLNVKVNYNDFNTIKQLNQRTNGIYEILAAEAINKDPKEKIWLTHGQIKNPNLAYKQTNQWSCDYYCARVVHKGQIYYYYADLKVTDKTVFFNKIASLHPNKLMLCQVYIVGGLDDSFIFNNNIKNQLITGCQHYMTQHIIDNTPLSQYNIQLNKDLQIFDSNPSVANYNSLIISPWRIFTVPSIVKIFNA